MGHGRVEIASVRSNELVQIADDSHTTLALISGTIADGTTASLVVLGMGVGLLAPKLVSDHLQRKSARLGAEPAGSSLYA
jgi:hypothetical protein